MSNKINKHNDALSFDTKFNDFLLRIFAAWSMSAFFLRITNLSNDFTNLSFCQDLSFIPLLAVFLVALFILSTINAFLPKLKIDGTAFYAFLFLYALSLSADICNKDTPIYFELALLAVIAVALFFLAKNDKMYVIKFNDSKTIATVSVICIGVISAAFISAVTVYRYISYCAPNYDFGIFCNMFYNMRTKLAPLATCERNGLLSHFAVHVSPIYYVLLPFYFIFPFPETLQIGQGIILASGVLPIYLICKNKKFSDLTSIVMCAIYAFYPALSCGCFYDIHENCFLTPLLLWVFYFFEKQNFTNMYIFIGLTLLVKEDAAVYIALFALYAILARKEYKHGFITFGVAVVYFLIVTSLLSAFGDGVMTYRYDNLIYGDGGLIGIFKTIFVNPGYVFTQIMSKDKLIYLLQMLLPLGFLPFVTKKTSNLLLLFPMILISLMTTYQYQYNIGFQYQFGIIAFLFYLSILNLSEISLVYVRKFIMRFSILAACVIFSITAFPKLTYYSSLYNNYKDTYTAMNNILKEIPKDASVKCTTFILPHIADRDEIYEIKYDPQNLHKTDYIILDMRGGYQTESKGYLETYLNNGYRVYSEYDNLMTILIRQDMQFS